MLCLDSNKLSTGCDGIPNVIYKTCSMSLSRTCSIFVYKQLLSPGVEVTQNLPNPKEILLVENYRPISLLCSISKIFEAAVLEKIAPFIHAKHRRLQGQAGTRPKI